MMHHLPVSVAFVVIAAASILHARTGAVHTVPVELQPLAAQVTRCSTPSTTWALPCRRAIARPSKRRRRQRRACRRGASPGGARPALPARRAHQSGKPRARCARPGARRARGTGLAHVSDQVRNEAGVTAPLRVSSPQALRVSSRGPRGSSMSPTPRRRSRLATLPIAGSISRPSTSRRSWRRVVRARGRVPDPAAL